MNQAKAKIKQAPFGMRVNGQHISNLTSNVSNLFLYNSKELQNQTNYLDYGFRQMDVQLGRWHVVDALAERYMHDSPYAYVGNNPISRTDFMGLTYQYKDPDNNSLDNLLHGGGINNYLNGLNNHITSNFSPSYQFGPTLADYKTYIAMGGNGSFGAWWRYGGRAGMSLNEFAVAAGGTTYVSIFGTAKVGSGGVFTKKGAYFKGYKEITVPLGADFSTYDNDPDGGDEEKETKRSYSFFEFQNDVRDLLQDTWLDKADRKWFNKPPLAVKVMISINPISNVGVNINKMITKYDAINQVKLLNNNDRFTKPIISLTLTGVSFGLPVGTYIFEGIIIQMGYYGAEQVSSEIIDSLE